MDKKWIERKKKEKKEDKDPLLRMKYKIIVMYVLCIFSFFFLNMEIKDRQLLISIWIGFNNFFRDGVKLYNNNDNNNLLKYKEVKK